MGYRVEPQAYTAFSDRQRTRQILSDSRMAVHFIGGQKSMDAINAIQDSLQVCRGATLVYELPAADLTDPERVLLGWIDEDHAAQADLRKYERINHKNLEEFLSDLRTRLQGAEVLRGTRVGIACEDTDRAIVEQIAQEIRDKTGFSVRNHGLSVLDYNSSRGVLYYWGDAAGKRLQQAGAAKLGLIEAWYLAPPPEPRKETDLPAMVLRQTGTSFQIKDIQPFLEKLSPRG